MERAMTMRNEYPYANDGLTYPIEDARARLLGSDRTIRALRYVYDAIKEADSEAYSVEVAACEDMPIEILPVVFDVYQNEGYEVEPGYQSLVIRWNRAPLVLLSGVDGD